MSATVEINVDDELMEHAASRAAELGLTPGEYLQRLLRDDLEACERPTGLAEDGEPFDISEMFDLVTDGPETDIAKDKDKLIGEAVWEEYLSESGQQPRRR